MTPMLSSRLTFLIGIICRYRNIKEVTYVLTILRTFRKMTYNDDDKQRGQTVVRFSVIRPPCGHTGKPLDAHNSIKTTKRKWQTSEPSLQLTVSYGTSFWYQQQSLLCCIAYYYWLVHLSTRNETNNGKRRSQSHLGTMDTNNLAFHDAVFFLILYYWPVVLTERRVTGLSSSCATP